MTSEAIMFAAPHGGVTVELDWYEIEFVSSVGIKRATEANRQNLKNKAGLESYGLFEHVNGAIGEYAAAKVMGRHWAPTVNTFRGMPDIAPCFEVRTRTEPWHDLIIRPDDPDEQIYILVTGSFDTYFVVHGGCDGRYGKRDEWLQTHGGRAPAYFVPRHELKDIYTVNSEVDRAVHG